MTALRELFYSAEVEFDKRGALAKGNKAINKTEKSVKGFDETVKSSTGSMRGLVAAVGGSATIAAFNRLISSTVESTNEIARWSARLGISERDMHNWSASASLYGASVEDVADSFKELQIKTRDAMTGGGEAGDAWKLLGVDVKTLEPILGDQVALMETFTRALAGVNEETQNFVVDEIMSDAGTRMLPLLRQGVGGIRALNEEADRMGGETFPELARETREYTRAQRRSNRAWTSLRNSLVSKVLPTLTKMLEKGEDLLEWLQEMEEKSNILKATMIVLGGVAAGAAVAAAAAWGAAIAPFLAAAAAVAVIALAIDDLYTTVEDPDSETLTRRFLEWALGARRAADVILFLNSAVADLRAGLSALQDFFFGEVTINQETGRKDITNLPSFIESVVEDIFMPGVARERADILRGRRRAARSAAQETREQESFETEFDLGGPVPGTVGAELAADDPFIGEMSVPREFRGEQRASQREQRRESRQRREEARQGARRGRTARREFEQSRRQGRETLPTPAAAGATLNVEQNLAVNIGAVNEATDARTVEEQATRAARQVADESQAAIARDLETLLGTSEEASSLIGLAGD
jgi:sRNA-binding protein